MNDPYLLTTCGGDFLGVPNLPHSKKTTMLLIFNCDTDANEFSKALKSAEKPPQCLSWNGIFSNTNWETALMYKKGCHAVMTRKELATFLKWADLLTIPEITYEDERHWGTKDLQLRLDRYTLVPIK